MKRRLITLAAGTAAIALPALLVCAGPLGWSAVKTLVKAKFSDVDHIEPAELAKWQAAGRKPLLLDVRAPEEFDVSHLAGARRVDPGAGATAIAGVPKDQLIVTYCSVGYRSGAFAERLVAAGYTNVHNLLGSIFQWANEGRPLVNRDGPATTVHPYDKTWGKLLDAKRRAKTAP